VSGNPKAFDCIETERRGQARVRERLAGLSREEEMEFRRRGAEELRAWRRARRRGEDVPLPDLLR
jgi:hypothetical protein